MQSEVTEGGSSGGQLKSQLVVVGPRDRMGDSSYVTSQVHSSVQLRGSQSVQETTHLKHWQSLIRMSGTRAWTPREVGWLRLLPLSTFREPKAEEGLGHYGTSEWVVALSLVALGGR